MPLSLINPQNQKGLRHVFDIKDPQLNPEHVDMGAVQPVIDMSFNGFAKLNDYSLLQGITESGDTIAGVQTKTWRVLSYSNSFGATTQIVVPPNHNFLIWGIKQHIYFNAAGAAAFNGKYISSELLMNCPDSGGTQITKWHGTGHVSSGCLLYAPGHFEISPLTKENIQVIPADCTLDIVWWAQDGSIFPANTVVVYAIAGQAFPVGAEALRAV